MDWIRLMVEKPSELKSASDTLYQAAQYIPMAARFFIPSKEDDSHTNADWNEKLNWMVGNPIKSPSGNIHVAIDYPLLVLVVCNDKLEPIAEFELIGKTRLEGFNWLNNQLWKIGLEVDAFEPNLHYELPGHPVLHGAKFKMKTPKYFLELADYRSNGHSILKEVTEKFTDKSDLRIWPHHFDDGIIINIKREGESVFSLISMGLAMPDVYYDQPYFYVNAWKKSGIEYKELPDIKGNGHWHQHEWTGQVLTADKFSSIIDHKEQEEVCNAFMKSAIENAISLLDSA